MQTRKRLLSFVLSGSLSLLLGAIVLPQTAQAGFQWVPSDQTTGTTTSSSTATTTAPVATAPVATTPMRSVAPVKRAAPMPAPLVIEGTAPAPHEDSSLAAESAPAQTLPTAESEIEPMAPASSSTYGSKTVKNLAPLRETAPAREVSGIAPASSPSVGTLSLPSADKAVMGFANNVPLSVALRQVMPASVAYTVAPDVSTTTIVSWKGGSSWKQTATDMLSPAGLALEDNGSTVKIVRAAGSVAPAATPAAPAAPTPAAPAALAPVAPAAPVLQPAAEGQPVSLSASTVQAASAAPVITPARPATPAGGDHFLMPPSGAIADVGPAPMALTMSQDMTPRSGSGSSLVDSWTASRGDSLHKILEDWAHRANVELSWLAEYDYPLQASVSFNGTFQEAVRGILSGLQDAKPQPIGTLHASQTSGQDILVIQVRGNNYND